MVNITLRVLSRPSVEKLPQIYQELSTDYDERILPSIMNEVMKTTVAQYNADQLLTQRASTALGCTLHAVLQAPQGSDSSRHVVIRRSPAA